MKNFNKKIDFNLNSQDLQPLPHSDSLECKVLGTVMKHPAKFKIAFRFLNASGMFYTKLNETVWKMLSELYAKGIDGSVGNVCISLDKTGDKETAVYASQLLGKADATHNLEKYCLILNEFWIRRTLCRMGYYMNQNALNQTKDPLELLSINQESAGKIFLHISKMREKTLADSAADLSEMLNEITNSPTGLIGLRSCIQGINSVIKGYRKGNTIVIAAGTAEGKTTLALNETQDWVENGIPVGYVSLEMSSYELMLMMASRRTGIPIDRIMDGKCTGVEMAAIDAYIAKLTLMPLHISETGGLTISEIKALGRSWKEKYQIQVLIIDHLHLANADDPSLNAEAKFTIIANELKALAKELEIPVIELAQLSRQEKTGKKRAHEITDLKYASGIEQAADVILLIYRPEHHGIEEIENEPTAGLAFILVGKLRLLPARKIKAYFNGSEFKDWDTHFNETLKPVIYDNPRAGMRVPEFIRSPLPENNIEDDEDAPF